MQIPEKDSNCITYGSLDIEKMGTRISPTQMPQNIFHSIRKQHVPNCCFKMKEMIWNLHHGSVES